MGKKWIIGIFAIMLAVVVLSVAGGILDSGSRGRGDAADEAGTITSNKTVSDADQGQENGGSDERQEDGAGADTTAAEAVFEETVSLDDQHLRDVDSLYEGQDDDSVVTMYLTVSSGNAAEGTDHTWAEINQYSVYDYEEMGVDRYKVEGLLQVGDEDGPSEGAFGAGETVPNATVQIRGQSSSRHSQKNYKIRIKENHGAYEKQRTINLNKHQSDGLRFRNKLGFDILRRVPQLTSLRTQFVHLYVRDLTEGGSGAFVDYGLYTQVEQLNRAALEARGLDRNGQLYKVNYFEFYRYEDVIRLSSDPAYDREAFEEYLEIKGSEDHSKLIRMLEAVNDYSIPIEEVIDEYFDMENLSYWMAFNLLTGNVDTINRNMFLYSPLNGNTWYLLCWDLDDMMSADEEQLLGRSNGYDYISWHRGVSNYWGNILFRRCLMSAEFRSVLDEAVNDIRTNMLTENVVRELTDRYRTVVKPYAYAAPDAAHEQLTSEQYDTIADHLPALPAYYYENYLESLERPMPFYIGLPENDESGTRLQWDASFDLDNERLTYTAVLARDPYMEDVVSSYTGEFTGTTVPRLAAGDYYLKVSVENSSGETQDAFDIVRTDDDKLFGMIHFYVLEDGSIELDS